VLPALQTNRKIPVYVFMGNNAGGAEEYVNAVGHDRALLGFAGASAYRAGNLVRYAEADEKRTGKTFAGELDGRITSRLACLANLFEGTGLPLEMVANMDAWLKYHAGLIVPLVCGVFATQSDLGRLARTRDALVLVVRAFRECSKGLRAAGIPPTPSGIRIYDWMPEPALVGLMGKLLVGPRMEITFSHAENTRPEMCRIAEQLEGVIRTTGIRTPYWDFLKGYLDPREPGLADGSQKLDLNWQEVSLPLAGLAAGAMLLRMLRK
jgi:2-dehydropantoate 2-reductase